MQKLEKSVRFWRGRIGNGTYGTYMSAFGKFMGWLAENGGALAGLSPDALIEYQKESDNGSRYDLLDLVQTWAQELKTPDGVDCRLSYKQSCYSAVRSFFSHNRGPLPRDPYTLRSETPGYEGTLTVENIRDVALASKPLYRAIFLSMFQSAMDIQSFLYWNQHGWEDLRRDLQDEYVDAVKISIPWRKMNRNPFCTFIGGDAIKAIRDYLPTRPTIEEARAQHERDGKQEPFYYAIFYTQFKTPIQKVTLQHYWIDRLEKLGLVKRKKGRGHRYGKNLHELRDVFRSSWEKSPAKASVAEYMMGHKVDPLEYNKAHKDEKWVKKEYKKGLILLQIMTSGRPYGQVEEEEVETLRDEVTTLRAQLEAATRNTSEKDVDFKDLKKDVKNIKTLLSLPQLQAILARLDKEAEKKEDKESMRARD